MVGESKTNKVLVEVAEERRRQDVKWGKHRIHEPQHWIALMAEELGEVARGMLKVNLDNYRAELIQLAALAVAACESLDLEWEQDMLDEQRR